MLLSRWSTAMRHSIFTIVIGVTLCGYITGATAVMASSTKPPRRFEPSTRMCFWCGPLGDQVYIKPRSPECSEPRQAIVCPIGYNYCATIATSKPFKISKYCVKRYEEECYSSFCNTTQKLKVICPCKGNFCNRDITDRETEAFSQVERSKRSLPRQIIADKETHRIVNTNTTTEENPSSILMHKMESKDINDIQSTVNNVDDLNNEKDLPPPMQNSGSSSAPVPNFENQDTVKTDIMNPTMPSEIVAEVTKQTQSSIKPETIAPSAPVETTSMITTTTIKEDLKEISITKPTVKPQVESLQQSASSKSNDEETVPATTTSETEDITTTTTAEILTTVTEQTTRKMGKNFALALEPSVLILIAVNALI